MATTNGNKAKRTGYEKRVDRMLALSRDDEVNRLERIVAASNRLGRQIGEFRRDHPPGHRCPCCTWIRELADGPSIHEALTAIEMVLWTCLAMTDAERPMGKADFRAMQIQDRELQKQVDAKVKADAEAATNGAGDEGEPRAPAAEGSR